MLTPRRTRTKRRSTAAFLVLLFPALINSVAPVQPASAGGTNYASRATAIAKALTSATTDEAAFDALMDFFDTANVTIVGEREGAMTVVSQGFGLHSQKDLFLLEDSVRTLAMGYREGHSSSISELSAAANLFMKPKASAKEMAQAIARWVKYARKQAANKNTDKGLFYPLVIDRLAKSDGVDLAKATAKTEIDGLSVYLALLTLAPQKSALAPTSARVGAADFDPCGMVNRWSRLPGVGTAITKGLGWFVGLVKKAVVNVIPLKVLDSLRGAAVALMTKVTPTARSIPLNGPPNPLHWRHFDDPTGQSSGTADPKIYELVAKSGIPISERVSNCLDLLGIEVPPEGEARSELPVIWWLDDGTPATPELLGQRLYDQGEWRYAGNQAGGILYLSDAAREVTARLPIGGQILGLGQTDLRGESKTELIPREEEGPYESGTESFVEGKLRAFPLTGGLDTPVELAASVVAAITKRLEWDVKINHHVKLGWELDAPPVSWTVPCSDPGCTPTTHTWDVSGFRCQLPEVFDSWWEQSARSLTQVPIDGLWYSVTDTTVVSESGTINYQLPRTFVVGHEGETTTMPFPDDQADIVNIGGGWTTTRLSDDPAAANVRLAFYSEDENGDVIKQAETTAKITPISHEAGLDAHFSAMSPTALACMTIETIRN